jgi:DNA-binding transcriptional MerR regulator
MTTAEVLERVEIPRQTLYYLEQKGFLHPRKKRVGEKEFRSYSQDDLNRLRAIEPHLKARLRYSAAIERALEDLLQPSLLPTQPRTAGARTR